MINNVSNRTITLIPADEIRHFASIATLMSLQESEPTTPESLAEWYTRQVDDGGQMTVAANPTDQVLGFTCLYRANSNLPGYYGVYLVVDPAYRGCGLGSLLYEHLLSQAMVIAVRTMRTRVRENSPESLRFATRQGFVEKRRSIEMMINLNEWDDAQYEPILQSLRAQGFHFTDMAELGDTHEARHMLYRLNNAAAATDPGSNGIPPWMNFEEFERDVCSSSWYHPDAQIVAINTHNGDWAAMSAITVFDGADHAYNLFTGTDVHYRGRKLAQAVKTLALRRARQFNVDIVRTSHNSENTAMIAIDNKLGYVRTPGMLVMEKELSHA